MRKTAVRIYQRENALSLCPGVCVCVCFGMAADRGFSCLGICLRFACASCVFFVLLRGDPTHRLSLADSVFIATERREVDDARGREGRGGEEGKGGVEMLREEKAKAR